MLGRITYRNRSVAYLMFDMTGLPVERSADSLRTPVQRSGKRDDDERQERDDEQLVEVGPPKEAVEGAKVQEKHADHREDSHDIPEYRRQPNLKEDVLRRRRDLPRRHNNFQLGEEILSQQLPLRHLLLVALGGVDRLVHVVDDLDGNFLFAGVLLEAKERRPPVPSLFTTSSAERPQYQADDDQHEHHGARPGPDVADALARSAAVFRDVVIVAGVARAAQGADVPLLALVGFLDGTAAGAGAVVGALVDFEGAVRRPPPAALDIEGLQPRGPVVAVAPDAVLLVDVADILAAPAALDALPFRPFGALIQVLFPDDRVPDVRRDARVAVEAPGVSRSHRAGTGKMSRRERVGKPLLRRGARRVWR
mmetsp:Transcript_2289/g.7728  ORF Transcript_2289/g.7728 Transcript_2289/m.7728 type:complete len:366 (-) Transcript_2289:539-1636(-)